MLWSNNPESGVICYGQGDGTIAGCQPNGYDADGDLIYKTDARAIVTRYGYDSLNHLTTKSYSAALQGGASAAAIAAATPPSTYVYGSSSTSVPNGVGRLISEFTGSQNAPITQRAVAYDTMGRIQQDTQCVTVAGCTAAPYAFSYQYDAAGNPYTSTTGVTNLGAIPGAPAGINLTYAYDGVGRLTTLTSNWDDATHPAQIFAPTGSIPQYVPAGLAAALLGVSSTSQQPSFGIARNYDNRMRLLGETDEGYGTGAPASAWINFDAGDEGALPGSHVHCPIVTGCQLIPDTGTITITLTSGTETFNASVDYQGESASDLASELAQALTGYDANNNPPMVNATTSNGTLTMTSLVNGAAGQYAVNVTFTNQSTPLADDYDNTESGSMTLGFDGMLGANTVYSYGLTYNANSNVAAVTDSVMGTWNYYYDSLNRLTAAQASANAQTGFAPYGGALLGWGYDSFGNYLGETLSGSTSFAMPQVNYTYAGHSYQNGALSGAMNNRIDGANYDAAGNVITDIAGNSYTYDAENRVLTAAGVSYMYDAEGNRVGKLSGAGLTEQYLLGLGGEQVAELDGSGNWQRTHVYGAGKELAKYDPNGVHFDFTDWLGTRRMQGGGATGSLEETCRSLPYGDSLQCFGPNGQPNSDLSGHHFTGKERDAESGLDYFGARYLSSNMGRFMSPDWAVKAEPVPYAKLDNPQSLNLYGYVENNPLSRFDADGHAIHFAFSDETLMMAGAAAQQQDYDKAQPAEPAPTGQSYIDTLYNNMMSRGTIGGDLSALWSSGHWEGEVGAYFGVGAEAGPLKADVDIIKSVRTYGTPDGSTFNTSAGIGIRLMGVESKLEGGWKYDPVFQKWNAYGRPESTLSFGLGAHAVVGGRISYTFGNEEFHNVLGDMFLIIEHFTYWARVPAKP